MSTMNETKISPLEILQVPSKITGIRVGQIVDIRQGKSVLVDFTGNPFGPIVARLTGSVSFEDALSAFQRNASVLITCEAADPSDPILFDIIAPRESETQHHRPAATVRSDEETADQTIASDASRPRPQRSLLGKISTIRDGKVYVKFYGCTEASRPVKTVVTLRDLTDDVLVLFPSNGEPVIVGQVYESVPAEPSAVSHADVVIRGNCVAIEAEKEITLRTGNCEIRLDGRGKAITTADHVVSRARGVNKVQGGSVRLN